MELLYKSNITLVVVRLLWNTLTGVIRRRHEAAIVPLATQLITQNDTFIFFIWFDCLVHCSSASENSPRWRLGC